MAQLFIDVLRSYTLAGQFKVHDFVVMRNHVHLLLTVDGTMTIEKAMQLIKGNFSYRAKKELGFMGEVWQRGFSDVRITHEASFSAHQEYIYNNPVTAGLANTHTANMRASECAAPEGGSPLFPCLPRASALG